MAPLPKIDDHWLWLGFGIFFVIASKGIQFAIKDIVRLTQLSSYADPTETPDTRVEDDLSLEHLTVLADFANENLSEAAVRIVVDRLATSTGTYRSIMADLRQTDDEDLRRRAQKAVIFLDDWTRMDLAARRPYFGVPLTFGREVMNTVPRITQHGFSVPRDPQRQAGSTETTAEELHVNGSTDGLRSGLATGPALEAERRRRRREAMVLRDGDGDVQEEDIIRPSF